MYVCVKRFTKIHSQISEQRDSCSKLDKQRRRRRRKRRKKGEKRKT